MSEKLSSNKHRTTIFVPNSIKNKLPDRINLSGLIRDLLQDYVDGKSDNNDWKEGFRELYSFFSEVVKDASIIRNKSLWNHLLQKRNIKLIDKLGDEL